MGERKENSRREQPAARIPLAAAVRPQRTRGEESRMRSHLRPPSSLERKRWGAPCGVRSPRERTGGREDKRSAEQSPRVAPATMRAAFAIPALAVLVSLASCRSPPKCNCNCPLNYDPVCVVDSKGATESYPTQCSFECYKCTHGKVDLRVKSRGECPNTVTRRPALAGGQKPGPNGPCNCACSFEYSPLCAGDSKGNQETYSSECLFNCDKCTSGKDLRIVKRGECSPNRPPPASSRDKNQRGNCNCKCPLNYTPVCAVDSRGKEETYPNSCALECYKCTHGKELRRVKQGECSGKTTPRPHRPSPPGRSGSSGNKKNCDCVCAAVYTPVCAVNSKGAERTFSSRCRMDCQNCQYNDDFAVRRNGECQARPPQVLPVSKARAA